MNLLCHKIFLFITFGILLSVLACEKDEPEPLYNKGVLRGTVTINSQLGEPAYNVQVKASGPYGSKKVLTNSEGNFEMNNLGNGTYEVEFMKEGLGTRKYYSVQVFGNDTIDFYVFLQEHPDFKLPALKYYATDQDQGSTLVLRSDLPVTTTEFPRIRAFVSKTRNVSCYNYDHTIVGYNYSTSAYIYYAFSDFDGFTRGETAFLIAYLYDINDPGYFDPYYGFQVFSSVDPVKHSPVIEFKIP